MFNPSIRELVTEIVAVNHAWKQAKDLFDDSASPLANSLRDLKTRLQIRLLRSYAPTEVYLVEDTEANYSEPVYSLQLIQSIDGWKDAAHLPIRVAQENLSTEELERFVNS